MKVSDRNLYSGMFRHQCRVCKSYFFSIRKRHFCCCPEHSKLWIAQHDKERRAKSAAKRLREDIGR